MKKILIMSLTVLLLLPACGSSNVKRVNANRRIDLSGYWNDIDVRIVCDALINDCLSSQRVDQAIRSRQRIPKVIVGSFRNESAEQIDTAIISSTMETVIFNSGKLDFVAGGSVRDEIRAERMDQQTNSSGATTSSLRNETGADFMLTGTVRSIVDREGSQTVRTYFVTAELTNIETNERIWMGQNNQIKKLISTPRNRL